jgi:hypothetical protein
VGAIAERLPKLTIGPGNEPESEMGPLVTREHRDKVAAAIERGREQGATLVADGREHERTASDGFFLGVSLLDNVTPQMDCYRDEIFGPVLSVVRADTYEEAVRLVNENPYGNGVAIYTRDGGAARQFQFEVEAGMVGVNVPIPVPVGYYSFGGVESVAVRRRAHVRPRGRAVLHEGQGRHRALARPLYQRGRPRLPADAVGRAADERASTRSLQHELSSVTPRRGCRLALRFTPWPKTSSSFVPTGATCSCVAVGGASGRSAP